MRLLDYMNDFDRRLVFPWMNTIGLRLTGYELYDVYNSTEKQMVVAKAMDENFQSDFIYPLDDGAVLKDTLQSISGYEFPIKLKGATKFAEILSKLTVPDPYKDGRMPINLATFKLLAESFNKPLAISVQGPFTLACEIIEVTDFIRAVIRKPDFVKQLLDFTTEVVSEYCQAVTKAGVRLLCISEPTAILLSPPKFEELVSVRLKRIFDALEPDAWRVLHVCGDTTKHMNQLLASGAEGLSLDQIVQLKEIAPKIPKDVVIIGNLDPVDVLADSTPAQTREKTLELLRYMKDYPNFLVSFGCDCLPDTPIENLKAAMETGRTKFTDF